MSLQRALFISSLVFLGFTASAHAEFNSVPDSGWPTVDYLVNAVIPATDGSIYVGGSFSFFGGTSTQRLGIFNTSATSTSDFYPLGANEDIRAVISDSAGRWYVAGIFTTIQGTTRNRIARLSPTGTLDTTFNPNINGTVNTLALSSDDSTLYVGGSFTTVNGGVTRNRLAAFPTSATGTVNSFNPNLNGAVNSMALSSDDTTLYTVGTFTAVNGSTTRNRAAAFTPESTSTATSFDPNIGVGSGATSVVLSSDNAMLYIGGGFTTVNGSIPRNRIAAFPTSATGTLDTAFDPNINSSVYALALSSDDSTLYAGGTFTGVNGGTTRNGLAAFTTSATGTVTSFDPDINGFPWNITLSSDDSLLYVAGNFSYVNQTIPRSRFAVFSTTGVGTVTGFDPSFDNDAVAIGFSPDNTTILIAGAFLHSGIIARNGVARILADKTVDQNFNPNVNGAVYSMALSPDESTLYIGGSFSSVNNDINIVRGNIAAIDTSATGTVTAFDPETDYTVYSIALSSDGATLYAGGDFSSVNNGVPYSYLAAFDTSATGTVTIFNPTPDFTVLEVILSPDNTTLYARGDFGTVNEENAIRNGLAAFSTTATGTVTEFDPGILSVTAITLSSDGTTLYVGGGFTTVNGSIPRNRLAAFITSATSTVTSFDPNLNSSPDSLQLSPNGEILYVGGGFTIVNGSTTRNRLAAFTTSATGTVTSFDPNVDAPIFAIDVSPSASKLYTGGSFTSIGGDTNFANFAVFSDLSSDSTPPSAVANLSIVTSTTSTVTLTWTSPGDDGTTGTATTYDIRYATSSISAGTFASAIQVSGEQSPSIASTTETFTVTGLASLTTYYFALKTSDEVPNTSSISNSPSSTTQSNDTTPPVITVLGDNPFTTTVNTAYVELGATATDDTDGTLTSSITTTSTVAITTPGTYTVTYSVTDAALNTGTATRTVVVSPLAGTVSIPQSYSTGYAPGMAATTTTPTPTPTSTPTSAPSSTQPPDLLALIASLQKQLQELQARAGQGTPSPFPRNLKLGDTGSDVKALQIYLNTKGFPVSLTGLGSKGQETTYFGRGTHNALIRFQEAYKAEILTPAGLTKGNGFFGPLTRGYVEKNP
jgi:hypothetical protein